MSPRSFPRRARVALSLGVAIALTASCHWDRGAAPGRSRVGGVSTAFYMAGGAGGDFLPVGDTATLRAQAYSPGWPSTLVYDSYRSDAEAQQFRWASDDPGVATIGASGLVTALTPGRTRLRAVVDGVESYEFVLTVYPAAASVAIEPVAGRLDARVADVVQFRLVARDAAGAEVRGVPITLYSSEYRVAGPIPNLDMTPSPGVQTWGAWRAGEVTLTATTPHPRPAARVTAEAAFAVADPGVAPDTLAHATSDLVLRASANRTTLRRGDTTTVRLTLYNRGAAPIRFTASPSCAVAFDVREGGGTIAWPRADRSCPGATPFVIAPGDSLVRETLWRADDGALPAAAPLTPGIYWIFPFTGTDGFFAVGATLMIRVLP